MRIAEILTRKNPSLQTVVTIDPDATVAGVVAMLIDRGVGALVVSPDGGQLVGIVSERDVVRHLYEHPDVLDRPVTELMTTPVRTCGPADTIEQVARMMTDLRVRHVPVIDDGRLAGLVSIGDVVKSRIDELEFERGQLEDYIHTGR
jgi:CBS domain-containing protein